MTHIIYDSLNFMTHLKTAICKQKQTKLIFRKHANWIYLVIPPKTGLTIRDRPAKLEPEVSSPFS